MEGHPRVPVQRQASSAMRVSRALVTPAARERSVVRQPLLATIHLVYVGHIDAYFKGVDTQSTSLSSFPVMSHWVDLCNRAIERSKEQSLITQTQTLGAVMVSSICVAAIAPRLISSLPPC
jgi:hypothetical protein